MKITCLGERLRRQFLEAKDSHARGSASHAFRHAAAVNLFFGGRFFHFEMICLTSVTPFQDSYVSEFPSFKRYQLFVFPFVSRSADKVAAIRMRLVKIESKLLFGIL